ncbi:MAG: helix-turn-helix domain-containing protein [Pirellulaceae bacterium]
MPQVARKKSRSVAVPDVLDLGQAASFLRLTGKTVEQLVKEQGLPGRKIGKEWRFLRTAVEDWLALSKAATGSVLDQFGALDNDPTHEEFRRIIEENRKRWNEEVA